jgi:uncharacterized protein YgiM (DUF1202 family)
MLERAHSGVRTLMRSLHERVQIKRATRRKQKLIALLTTVAGATASASSSRSAAAGSIPTFPADHRLVIRMQPGHEDSIGSYNIRTGTSLSASIFETVTDGAIRSVVGQRVVDGQVWLQMAPASENRWSMRSFSNAVHDGSGWERAGDYPASYRVRTAASGYNIRSAPSLDASIVETVPSGTVRTVIADRTVGDKLWYQLRPEADGRERWSISKMKGGWVRESETVD